MADKKSTRQCHLCQTTRDVAEMAKIDSRWYCHPSESTGATCYSTASAIESMLGGATTEEKRG